nr:hypothetical protein [Tanacetum cinerariifolium]
MANVNVNTPANQAPTMAPPTRTDYHILPHIRWIVWGVVNRAHLDYAERIWEEFTQSIHTFIEDKKNLAQHTHGKKEATLIVIPSIRFTKLTIYRLQRKHKFHPSPDSSLHLPNEEPVLGYLKFSAKGTKREVFGMPISRSDPDSPTPKPTKTAKKSKPTTPKRALKESLKSMYDVPRGLLPPVVIREPEFGKYQSLLEVSGKGKEKVTKEQVARDLLTLQTPKKKSPADRYIFQRRTSTPTGSSGHDESSSLYAELGLTDSEEESDEDVPGTDAGVQGEGQARPNPDAQDEGQAGPNPDEQAEGQAGPNLGDAKVSQPLSSPVVHAGSDLEHMDLNVSDVSTQPHPEQMDEGFTATAYSKVQENLKLTVEEHVITKEPTSSLGTLSSLQHLTKDLSFGDVFFNDKPSKADSDKATAKTKVESMVAVTIKQDTSSIPPMTTPIIDLTSRPESPTVQQLLKATATETTTTTIHPPPSQPQQSITYSMLMKRTGELEHIMANLIQDNKHLEQRLDSHGECLYTLENLDIPSPAGHLPTAGQPQPLPTAVAGKLFRRAFPANPKMTPSIPIYKIHHPHATLITTTAGTTTHRRRQPPITTPPTPPRCLHNPTTIHQHHAAHHTPAVIITAADRRLHHATPPAATPTSVTPLQQPPSPSNHHCYTSPTDMQSISSTPRHPHHCDHHPDHTTADLH